MKKKTLAEQAEEKFGKKNQPGLKERLNNWLDENVNQPLHKKGYSKTGSAISALGATIADEMPENAGDVAMAMIPGGWFAKKGLKAAKKGLKAGAKELTEDVTKVTDRGDYKIKGDAIEDTKESGAYFSDLDLPKKPRPPTFTEFKKMTPEQRKAAKELEDQAPSFQYSRDTDKQSWGSPLQRQGVKPPTFKK